MVWLIAKQNKSGGGGVATEGIPYPHILSCDPNVLLLHMTGC